MPTRHNGRDGASAWTAAWELREEIEQRFSLQCTLQLIPPSSRKAKDYTPPQVCAIVHTFGKNPRAVCQRKVFVSSVRGASSTEAAAHRALSELWYALEELEADAAQQASF